MFLSYTCTYVLATMRVKDRRKQLVRYHLAFVWIYGTEQLDGKEGWERVKEEIIIGLCMASETTCRKVQSRCLINSDSYRTLKNCLEKDIERKFEVNGQINITSA